MRGNIAATALGLGFVQLAPVQAGTLTTLAFFTGSTGSTPYAELIADASGTLYGTTSLGGTGGQGTVFSLTRGGTLTTLTSFNGANAGCLRGAGQRSAALASHDGKAARQCFFRPLPGNFPNKGLGIDCRLPHQLPGRR